MIAFITFKSSVVPLFEGLWSSNSWEFELSGFRRHRTDDQGIDSPSLWPTEPRLHVRSIWQEILFSRNCLKDVFDVRMSLFEIFALRFRSTRCDCRKDSYQILKGFRGFPHSEGTKWKRKVEFNFWWKHPCGETITKDQGSCDGLESDLWLSRKKLPLGYIYIDSSHHEIEFRVPDVRGNSFGARRLGPWVLIGCSSSA